ncbi:MAG TPA: response regulator [Candidatus Angelobacter sp.]|nr:response regulator [Candidatus Angelobacter sp.]
MKIETERLQLDLRHGTETILLVDDEESLRAVVTHFLSQELGYNLLSVGSAEEALDLVESYSGHIDLLLTDILLPGMSGPELARKMGSSHPEIRIMYISGYADQNLESYGVSASDIMQKPFTIKTLSAKLREILDKDDEESGDQ